MECPLQKGSNAMTQNEIEFQIKLESIFLPHSRRQRNRLYIESNGSRQPARFVHYTSAEAGLKIIQRKRLWMRNTTCMSDYREVQHGYGILTNFFSDKGQRDVFERVIESCAPGSVREALGLFDQWWVNIQYNTFITSISEHDEKEDLHGRLSMWRAFGGNGARVAIVFKIPWHSEGAGALNLMFSPVAYLTGEEVQASFFEVIDNVKRECAFLATVDRPKIIEILFTMFVATVTCLKHEGFREEREWRAIYSPTRMPSPLMKSSVETVNGIPQVVFELPLDGNAAPELADLDFAMTFERLILGPSQYPAAMVQAFLKTLRNAGIEDAEKRIVISGIPIRT
jgi:hypothetical protein